MQVITDAMTLVDTMDGMPVGGQVETFVVIEGGQEDLRRVFRSDRVPQLRAPS